MENASKALIIAGAILLSILIIAIGMFIFNSSSDSIYGAADSLSQYDIDSFNTTWTTYEGKQPGTNVKALLNKLIANANTFEEESSKLPDIMYKATSGDGDYQSITSIAGDTKVKEMSDLRNKIEARHIYFVTTSVDTKTSLVNRIEIGYNAYYEEH